ncbi:hypothetical protein TcYC6_0000090 [Trypanosoma cruzi]|nr:hypothetical protein TcYC6_0000090 [Trypanosoma cruzi]
MTGFRFISGSATKPLGGFEPYGTCCGFPGASSTKFRGSSVRTHRVRAARELGVQQGPIIAERERSRADRAHAIADVRDRSFQLYLQAEEAHNFTCRCANLTSRSPAAFSQNGDTRSPDANSSWRQPAPNSINEGHALVPERHGKSRGRRRRQAGKKPPPLGAVLQKDRSCVKRRTKTVLSNSRIKRVA